MRKFIALGVLALAVTGCNRPAITTDEPVFTPADAEGAPRLRLGVWASPSFGCDYDPGADVKSWPSCARGQIVGDGVVTEGGAGRSKPYVLAAGYPRVLQVQEAVPAAADRPARTYYAYDAIAPSRFDAKGRIVAARRWPASCPPVEEGKVAPEPCVPLEAAAVRVAARDDSGAADWIWLRDGER